jgi:hypothetical protein
MKRGPSGETTPGSRRAGGTVTAEEWKEARVVAWRPSSPFEEDETGGPGCTRPAASFDLAAWPARSGERGGAVVGTDLRV